MPRKRDAKSGIETGSLFSIPAPEALSFLKETRGVSTWTAQDMAKALRIGLVDAKKIIPYLELQGYIKQSQSGEWLTTLSGEGVSGSKTPRYTPERVEEALANLGKRISEANRDAKAPFKIVEAVAFGDFLSGRARVQAPDVGIELQRRSGSDSDSATEWKSQKLFLKQLAGERSMLPLRQYEKWMSARTHRRLL